MENSSITRCTKRTTASSAWTPYRATCPRRDTRKSAIASGTESIGGRVMADNPPLKPLVYSRRMIVGIDIGVKNCGVCAWNPTTQTIAFWEVWTLPGTRAPEVIRALETNTPSLLALSPSTIIIEHQPIKNPTMVRLMHYLECYFTMKGYTVHFQDSKNKLLYASTMTSFPQDSTDREWTYRYRKQLAVRTVEGFLGATGQTLATVFHTSKKKDDLADALLHAMAYVQYGRVIGSTNV